MAVNNTIKYSMEDNVTIAESTVVLDDDAAAREEQQRILLLLLDVIE
jgi:hypothetical protein